MTTQSTTIRYYSHHCCTNSIKRLIGKTFLHQYRSILYHLFSSCLNKSRIKPLLDFLRDVTVKVHHPPTYQDHDTEKQLRVIVNPGGCNGIASVNKIINDDDDDDNE